MNNDLKTKIDDVISISNEKFQLLNNKINFIDKKFDNKFDALTKKLGGKLNIKGEIEILDNN
jgi:hypothetical protein